MSEGLAAQSLKFVSFILPRLARGGSVTALRLPSFPLFFFAETLDAHSVCGVHAFKCDSENESSHIGVGRAAIDVHLRRLAKGRLGDFHR